MVPIIVQTKAERINGPFSHIAGISINMARHGWILHNDSGALTLIPECQEVAFTSVSTPAIVNLSL
jgi:hypothetical protein